MTAKKTKTSKLIAIDPGLRYAGIALFEDDVLVDCNCIHTDDGVQAMAQDLFYAAEEGETLVIEYMVPRRNLPAAWNNLTKLSMISGGVIALWPNTDWHLANPSAWTGNRPKKVNHPRIRRGLTSEEAGVLEANLAGVRKSNQKEIIDAVGIGLWHLGRL